MTTNDWIAIFTLLLVIVGALQAYFVLGALKATDRAAHAAIKSADAAKINADILIRQNAPFIRFASAELEFGSPERPKEPHMFYSLQNFGDGRAFVTEIANDSLLIDDALPQTPSYTYKRVANYDFSEITVERMEKIKLPVVVPDEIKDLVEFYQLVGEVGKRFYIYGFVKCSDVLRQTHIFGFGYEWSNNRRFVMAGGETYNYYRFENSN